MVQKRNRRIHFDHGFRINCGPVMGCMTFGGLKDFYRTKIATDPAWSASGFAK